MSAKDDGRRVLFGVAFTAEQWAATNTHPPLWHLHPPKREDYDGDKEYAEGERAYADRVLAARNQEPKP